MPSEEGIKNLKPFTGGPDERRYVPQRGRGNHSKLNDPDVVDAFAKAVTEGCTTKQLAGIFAITDRTVRLWKNDARVKASALKFINDRIIRITSKADAKVDALLNSRKFQDLPIDDQVTLLLKVRKEYLGGTLRLQAEAGELDADTINDAMEELESNPGFAAELRELLERAPASNA